MTFYFEDKELLPQKYCYRITKNAPHRFLETRAIKFIPVVIAVEVVVEIVVTEVLVKLLLDSVDSTNTLLLLKLGKVC